MHLQNSIVKFHLLFCSWVELYLQTAGWPYPCESDGAELEEPVKKKPCHTQVCCTLNVFHALDNLQNEIKVDIITDK